ncbi:hypothetical protein FNF29_06168 [Cafeteria roenbergensis]|uniref:Guanylate cyclase domain-containing protein n=1 Tax=Cafeteria roenbergensis TaxID=33653 RepID=A0A5A8CAN3_CAFRO|nr:hypothetical protein FNF29_06168 [Cafeteria roenbergensis]|eukprot:KAA0149080.1 hypothetical protein FNF29_06168 [Cafeteria roenbergensis]
MPVAAACVALAAAVVPYWPVSSATLIGVLLHMEPIASGTESPRMQGLVSLCMMALFVACGVFAWAPPRAILVGSTAVVATALAVRAASSEPWMPSNLGMAVTTGVFSVAAVVWLSSKVFATGIDALVDRMHMRRHAFHSESLMRGGFPPPVARALLVNVPARDLCREVSSASIAFIHLSDYDAIIDKFSAHPKRLVQTQDVIWTALDSLLETFPGAEKVETVGSAYLVAAGLVELNPRHAEILAHFCLHVLEICKNICGQHVAVSIGLHSGPVVGGIVGRTRAFYRVYGETVNVASRMMSHGMPATLHCSWSTATLLASSPSYQNGLIELVACGFRKVKGIGLAPTFFVNYRRPGVPVLAAAIGGAGFSSQHAVQEMLRRGKARRDDDDEDSSLPTVSELLRYPALVPPPVDAPDDRLANQLLILAYVVQPPWMPLGIQGWQMLQGARRGLAGRAA